MAAAVEVESKNSEQEEAETLGGLIVHSPVDLLEDRDSQVARLAEKLAEEAAELLIKTLAEPPSQGIIERYLETFSATVLSLQSRENILSDPPQSAHSANGGPSYTTEESDQDKAGA